MRRMLLIKKKKSSTAMHFRQKPAQRVPSPHRAGHFFGQVQPCAGGGWQVGTGTPSQGDVPIGVRLVQGDQGNPGVLMLECEHARQKGDTQSCRDQVDDKVDLPATRRYPWRHTFELAGGEDFGVQGEAGFEQDERGVGEVGEVDAFAPRQWVAHG